VQRHHSHHSFVVGWPNPNFRDPTIAPRLGSRTPTPSRRRSSKQRPRRPVDAGQRRAAARVSWDGAKHFYL
jgi:hypothetical protein